MATRNIYTTTFDEDVQQTTTECPDCGDSVRTSTGETVCEDCGLVLEDTQIDRGPDWNQYDEQQAEKRTGAPLTLTRHDRGLSTEIGRYQDGNGNSLSSRKRRQLNRLRREQSRAQWQSKANRNLGYGLGEVRRLSSSLGFGERLRDQACALFRRAQSENLCVGRSLEAVAAASVYAACRCNGLGRSRTEIAATARCELAALSNAYNVMNVELELPAQPVSAADHLPKLASELEVSARVRRRALEFVREATDAGITVGCRPAGVAAACLYLAVKRCGLFLSQREIATVAGVSPTTLRNRRDELLEM